MPKSFDELWGEMVAMPFTPVQNKAELEWMFDRMKGAKSYLEIGSSFGGSLYVLGHAMDPGFIMSIDMPKGRPERDTANDDNLMIVKAALEALGHEVVLHRADSHDLGTVGHASEHAPFDVVLIDGDHSYLGVAADWKHYGKMGRKVFFHDILAADGAKRVFDEIPNTEKIEVEFGMGMV